jgi:ABC-2 type transport system ATP-binding protein
MPIIETRDVKKVYTKTNFNWRKFGMERTNFQALKGINLEVEAGEFLGFIGPNGAGKTTFLKILAGIMIPSSGMVNVLGSYPFDKRFDYLRQIALVMGNKNALWWDLPAIDSFKLQRDIYGVKESDFDARLKEISKVLDIEDLLPKRLRSMSLGERMKCELSACLLHRPKVVFLDEPTIGLDVISSRAIRKFLKRMNKEEGITFILTSHYLADIEELCERVVIINKGDKIYDGKLLDLKRKYAPEKEIKVYLETDEEKELFNELAVGDKKIEEDSGIITAKSSEVGDIASDLFNTFGAENITIGEPDIEDIIVKIFKN